MTIPSSKYLKKKAANRIASGQDPRKVVLVYAAIAFTSSFLVTAVRYALAHQIAQTGGLSNIGLRSILSTMDRILPVFHTILTMCLELGYLAAMLRIARRQFASPRTLKAGAERFGPLLRKNILQALIYTGGAVAGFYIAIGIFLVTPLSRAFSALAIPMVEASNYNPEVFLQNEDAIAGLMSSMTPLFVIYIISTAAIVIPIMYRYRLTNYLIVDHPGMGAIAAMRDSRLLMRGNRLKLLRLDLSFWWFYLMQAAALVLCYLDVVLAYFGITLPLPDAVSFLGSFLIYLLADFAILYYFKNQVAVTYALAYDAIIPHEEHTGVALGNIFTM